MLAVAYETLDAEKCGKCGVPAWHAFSEDNRIAFAMDEHECHACAHKDKEDEKVKKEKPGVTRFVKAVPEQGFTELPSRSEFQMDMLKKALKATEKETSSGDSRST